MHQLRIVFTCMCAYLPRKDDVLVVIPDGRPKAQANGHHGHHAAARGAPPHVAAIQFDPDDLSPGNQVKPHLVFRRTGAREQALYFLTGHDIGLEPAPPAPVPVPAIRSGRGKNQQKPPTLAEAEDFSWVADISKLDAASGVMDPACTAPGDSAGGRVVARMSLKGGSLSTLMLGTDPGDKTTVIVYPFREPNTAPEHKTYKQALATAVCYDVAVPNDEITLVLKPFGTQPERLVFSFAGRPMGDTLQILVKNMPLDSLLEVGAVIDPGYSPEVDTHFLMYYSLSKTPGKKWIPFSRPARPLGPVCPSARFVE